MATPKIPRSLFSKRLDSFATSFLKNTGPIDERAVKRLITLELLSISEALIVSPSVTFKTYGENVVLALLLHTFGVKGVEALLDQRAIDFALWTPLVTYSDDPQMIALQLNPLQAGTLSDSAHSDPLASCELGIRGWSPEISEADAKRVAQLAAARTIVPQNDLAHQAVARLERAYEKGDLRQLGFEAMSRALLKLSSGSVHDFYAASASRATA